MFNKTGYWKERTVEKIQSCFKEVNFRLRDILEGVEHAKLDKTKIRKTIMAIEKNFNDLEKEVKESVIIFK